VDCHQKLKFDFDHGYQIVLLGYSTTKINIIVQIVRNSNNFYGLDIHKSVFIAIILSISREKQQQSNHKKPCFHNETHLLPRNE